MAATIRTTCAECGTVSVAVGEAQLRLGLNDSDRRNTVAFSCPRCGRAQAQRVGERATRLLSAAGIEVVMPRSAMAPQAGAISGDEVDAAG